MLKKLITGFSKFFLRLFKNIFIFDKSFLKEYSEAKKELIDLINHLRK